MIALYRGRSVLSRAIRWQTRGEYSHAAWVLPDRSVIEAWAPGGVQHNVSLGRAHTAGTVVDLYAIRGLTAPQHEEIERFLRSELGGGYDYGNLLKFMSRRRGGHNERWFCSELVFAACVAAGVRLLERIAAWQVSPSMLALSPLLVPAETVETEEVLEDP